MAAAADESRRPPQTARVSLPAAKCRCRMMSCPACSRCRSWKEVSLRTRTAWGFVLPVAACKSNVATHLPTCDCPPGSGIAARSAQHSETHVMPPNYSSLVPLENFPFHFMTLSSRLARRARRNEQRLTRTRSWTPLEGSWLRRSTRSGPDDSGHDLHVHAAKPVT